MLNKLIEIIESPVKAFITTATGTATGYVPTVINNIADVSENSIDRGLQHAVWTFTILVAISAIISWVQKQRDRWIKNHPKKNNDSLYLTEEDDD